jgi:hypothetical protein
VGQEDYSAAFRLQNRKRSWVVRLHQHPDGYHADGNQSNPSSSLLFSANQSAIDEYAALFSLV